MQDAAAYIVSFASILFGLAVGDLLLDLDRLLKNRRKVRWHPLPLLAAAFVMFVVITGWWDLYSVLVEETSFSIADFFPQLVKLVLVFLIAAAALPSDVSESTDLKQYYFDNHRYFYTLFCLLALWLAVTPLLTESVSIVVILTAGPGWFLGSRILAYGILAWTRREWVHWILLPLLSLSFVITWLHVRIG
jgi:hypothetical protein